MTSAHSAYPEPGIQATESGSGDISAEQQNKNEAALQFLASLMADPSGYDERVWPALQQNLEADHTSNRKLFGE